MAGEANIRNMCGTGEDKANHCHARNFDGSIRMFTSMAVLFMMYYLLSIVSNKCTSLTPKKKMIINFVASTLGAFIIITVLGSGVIPNDTLAEKRNEYGEFYSCDTDTEGYVVNGFPYVTKGRPLYLHANIIGTDIKFDEAYKKNPLRDEERHFYHLLFSFAVGCFVSFITSLKRMVGGQRV